MGCSHAQTLAELVVSALNVKQHDLRRREIVPNHKFAEDIEPFGEFSQGFCLFLRQSTFPEQLAYRYGLS
jgi:hypothetical protein